MAEGLPVTFVPAGVTVEVAPGTTVLEAARRAGLPLPSTCGGEGTCGDCAVRVVAGETDPPGPTEAAALASAPPDVRLACMLRVRSPLTVRPLAPFAAGASLPPEASPVRAVAAAIDLGTTTITASLLDDSGLETSSAAVANPQRTFGGDVASRLTAALEGNARELQDLAMRGMDTALTTAGDPGTVARLVVAGNTVMSHLALAAEVGGLASHPYAGSLSGTIRTAAGTLGLDALPPETRVVFLPPIAAFVGGDVTAGVLATDLDEGGDVRVLIDLGTNAEVVVAAGGRLTVASAAAGPAFEAAGLACGGPAQPGAIRDVRFDGGDLALDVIGATPAAAICGSGALALVGVLLDAGHLRPDGRLTAEGPLAARFHDRGDVLAIQLSGERRSDRDVYLTQLDVRELQLAKAAVATALELTMKAAGIRWRDVAEVLVAGAFGAGVDERLLRRIGVLPEADVPVTATGDAALTGAELVAHDEGLESRVEAIAAEARGVDLAAQADFQSSFLDRTELRPFLP